MADKLFFITITLGFLGSYLLLVASHKLLIPTSTKKHFINLKNRKSAGMCLLFSLWLIWGSCIMLEAYNHHALQY